MNKRPAFSLFNRLIFLTGFLTMTSIVMAEIYFMHHERAILELGLRDKVNFITNYYALGIAEALQRNDDIMLQQVINGLEQDHDITSVIVVDGDGEIRYHVDSDKVGTTLEDPIVKKALETGDGIAMPIRNAGGRALELVAPLKAKGQNKPQGAVRLEITYRHIESQVHAGPASFEMMAIGCIFSSIGAVLWGFKRWVLKPLAILRGEVMRINPALLESNLPETPDEFGEINKSLNGLLARLKSEWNAQREAAVLQAKDESLLIEQIVGSFFPNSRLLLIDRENRVISDSKQVPAMASGNIPHLLDLIDDAPFSTLIANAMQNEGVAAHGRVTFEANPYEASVLRIPQGQSKLIRMVVILRVS